MWAIKLPANISESDLILWRFLERLLEEVSHLSGHFLESHKTDTHNRIIRTAIIVLIALYVVPLYNHYS